MKRFLALALTCLLAACGTQQRPADEPDFSTDPNTPVESPEPRLGEIESLISQAKLEIKRRDFDEARVKLHQVFRRDRWNPEANTIYQDLQISRGMGDALYQEYLDLYEANKARGDALWFHLRPLLIKRGIKACEVEKHAELTAEQRAKIAELEALPAAEGTEAQRKETELHRIDQILALDPMNDEWVYRRAYIDPEPTRNRYKEISEENPGSGDALYLYATTLYEANDAIEVLRRGWILDLPGANLRLGLAKAVFPAIDSRPVTVDGFRMRRGRFEVAFHFYQIFDLTVPGGNHAELTARSAKEAGIELEILPTRD